MTDIDQVVHLLTDESTQDEVKLQTIKNLKTLFKNFHESFGKATFQSFINSISFANTDKKYNSDFLHCYGIFLVNFLDRDPSLYLKVLQEILLILFELKYKSEYLLNNLVKKLWIKLETVKNVDPKFICELIIYSKQFFENVVMEWIEEMRPLKKNDFFIKMSIYSPKLFQTIVAIIYQIIIKAKGNYRFLRLMNFFVNSVHWFCKKKNINFIHLFPWDCQNVVSLLLELPKLQSVEDENKKLVTEELITNLLSDLYFTNQKGTLMLVSIFPDWIKVLHTYLGKTC